MLTVGSLFAGIGGLELGLEQTGGFRTIWSVEIEEFCNEIRKRHWPEVPQYKDIQEFPPTEGVERPDLICGGSPCQDLSTVGNQAGLGGERSGLFLEMVRIIRELQPRYVVWENVRDVLSCKGGRDFRTVLGHFSDIGYNAEWTVLRAYYFGIKQRRPRVFLVAYRQSMCDRRKQRNSSQKEKTPQNRKKEVSSCISASKPVRGLVQYDVPGPTEKKAWEEILDEEDWRAPSVEPGIRRNINGVSCIVDVARRARLKALGNAVVPACARWVGERILERERKINGKD